MLLIILFNILYLYNISIHLSIFILAIFYFMSYNISIQFFIKVQWLTVLIEGMNIVAFFYFHAIISEWHIFLPSSRKNIKGGMVFDYLRKNQLTCKT